MSKIMLEVERLLTQYNVLKEEIKKLRSLLRSMENPSLVSIDFHEKGYRVLMDIQGPDNSSCAREFIVSEAFYTQTKKILQENLSNRIEEVLTTLESIENAIQIKTES